MGLPSRFMELSSRMYPRPAPQLPLWIPRHNTRSGGLLVSHGRDGRRQDNSGGVSLCLRFLASAANNSAINPPVSSARRQQYFFPAGSGGCHGRRHPPSSSATKDDGMLSARARGRRWFSGAADAFTDMPAELKQAEPSLVLYRNLLKMALLEKRAPQKNRKMLEALVKLKEFVKDCNRRSDAKELLSELLSPLEGGLGGGGGGGLDLDDAVVKESLEVARLLMDTVSKQVRVCLCNEQKPKDILEGIIIGGSRLHSKEVIELAKEILAKLSPATP